VIGFFVHSLNSRVYFLHAFSSSNCAMNLPRG